MKKLTIIPIALIAFLLGGVVAACVQGQASAASAQANTVAAGSECFIATLFYMQGKDLNAGNMPKKTVHIPAGWEVKGGAGQMNAVVCRDL